MIVCAPAPEGVSETSLMVEVKERIFVPPGGVRGVASMVTLTTADPELQLSMQPPPLGPEQEEKIKAATKTRKTKSLLRFIGHPRVNKPHILRPASRSVESPE